MLQQVPVRRRCHTDPQSVPSHRLNGDGSAQRASGVTIGDCSSIGNGGLIRVEADVLAGRYTPKELIHGVESLFLARRGRVFHEGVFFDLERTDRPDRETTPYFYRETAAESMCGIQGLIWRTKGDTIPLIPEVVRIRRGG